MCWEVDEVKKVYHAVYQVLGGEKDEGFKWKSSDVFAENLRQDLKREADRDEEKMNSLEEMPEWVHCSSPLRWLMVCTTFTP
jgi:hypothetical protein